MPAWARRSFARICPAARAAHAHEFILRLAQGYDSLVGERGQGLSGGERQRISIARALLIDPRILILDEATSSVDTETEKEIQRALDNLVQGPRPASGRWKPTGATRVLCSKAKTTYAGSGAMPC